MIQTIPQEKLYSNEFALLYGIMLGDGCISKVGKKHYFISIVGNLKKEIPFYTNIIIPIVEDLIQRKINLRKRITHRKLEIIFSNKSLFFALKKIGFQVGKKGNKLSIPPLFSFEKYKYLIQGYFATDGSFVLCNNNGIVYPRIEFSGISNPLLTQVYEYLIKIGIKGYMYIKSTYPEKNQQKQWRLQFNGKENLDIFHELIGFVNKVDQEKYNSYQNYKKMAMAGFETATSR